MRRSELDELMYDMLIDVLESDEEFVCHHVDAIQCDMIMRAAELKLITYVKEDTATGVYKFVIKLTPLGKITTEFKVL